MLIDKFSVALSFQNLKNADINILEWEIYFNLFIKISQFEFVVTAGQRVLAYKPSLSLNIPDFSVFFFKKLQSPWKKFLPSFPESQKGPVKPLPFEKFGRIINPSPAEREEIHTMVCWNALIYYYFIFFMRKNFCVLCFGNIFVFPLLLMILRFLYV